MRKANAAEWVLRRAAGEERGTAMYGDLVELAASRGRLWFWAAYARTLLSFIWRTPIAVLAGVAGVKYLRAAAFRLFARYMPRFIGPHLQAGRIPYLSHFSWVVSWCDLLFLFIVLPYVAVRFGLRNRLTYLAGALLLLAAPMYTFQPQVYNLTGLASALIVVAALASPAWRRQMIFLMANCAAAYLVFYFCIVHPPSLFLHGGFLVSVLGMPIEGPVGIVVTVLIGPPLHRWLMEPQSTGVAHA